MKDIQMRKELAALNLKLSTVGKPACGIEREITRDEIDEGLRTGAEKLKEKSMNNREDERYHNTKYLLKQFRRVSYAVKVSEAELNVRLEMEHGVKLSTFEINADLAGIDLSGTRAERYAQSIIRSRNMLQIIENALNIVREDPDDGEVLYQVLYETYCTPRKPRNRDEICANLEAKGIMMAPSTYHKYMTKAIHAFDSILWGFTARDCLETVKNFVPEL